MGTINKIYILHGWAYSTVKWHPFLQRLSKNGVEYDLLKIPGLTAPLHEVWTLDDYVKWLHSKVERQGSKVILLGHSNGGRISMAFATKYPKMVSHLILIDSAGIYHDDIFIQFKRTAFKNLAQLKRFINLNIVRNIFYKLVREYDYKKASPVMKKVLQNLIESDKNSKIHEIRVPTTIIWGEKDGITPLNDGKQIHEKISGSSLKIVRGAGHSPQYTHPNYVAEIVFLQLQ